MDGTPNHPIKWGTYREGVRSQLQRFESLPQDGLALMQSYQAVLDNDETFTQYFSDEPLESYTIESRLRETLGIHPPSSSDTESSRDQNDPSISWVNIFRHGSFEKQSDGSYHCYDQGNLVKIDEPLHKSILLNRCFLPANSYLWPSPADAERESEVTLAIEADILDEIDRKVKYVEKLKRLQLALKKRRIKLLQGVQDPVKRSRTPQTPGLQYPTPSESLRPTVSVETYTRARSSSQSSGVSSGSDIPFTAPGDTTRPVSYDSDDDNDDAVNDSDQQENSNVITESDQKAYENGMGVSVSGLLSSRKPQVAQSQDHTQSPKPFQGDGSAKHQLHGNEDLTRPPLKKQKTETAPSPAEIETIDLSEELPMWKGKVDTPTKPEPTYSSTGKKRKGQKRTRNNFTDYEKEHAPAWFKSQINAGKPPSEIEKAYVEKFGVFHRWLTVKLWVDRMDERAAKAEKTVEAENPSKIVPIRTFPTSRVISAADAAPSSRIAAAPPYVSPYPLFRSPQQPGGSPVPYQLDWPSKTAASTSFKSGLPNVY
ncbi:hypothetical protein N7519_007440 [Penicillium mononematosum]|uniref:uncharacterized protein n=1 Tax=Penicillium mononematosum TaxID=268346 RepID=UPI002548C0F4|nr:uncharacterized protein N7519_007440 [Penicillium mononematosum]KAJ6186139.1 hypothetical protein N7519_007440 [Penicillium mononematosum]